MLAEKVRDLGLNRLGQQSTRPIPQDFGELIVDVSWLTQLDDVIFGHGISLLRWRSGGVKHPHDMPPSRFPPSPTFSDSSPRLANDGSCVANEQPFAAAWFVTETACHQAGLRLAASVVFALVGCLPSVTARRWGPTGPSIFALGRRPGRQRSRTNPNG